MPSAKRFQGWTDRHLCRSGATFSGINPAWRSQQLTRYQYVGPPLSEPRRSGMTLLATRGVGGDEVGEVVHALEDEVGAAGVESVRRHQFGETEHIHACRYRASHSDGAVFDDEAALGIIDSHGPGRMQVNIGMRFATFDIAGTENFARKKRIRSVLPSVIFIFSCDPLDATQ